MTSTRPKLTSMHRSIGTQKAYISYLQTKADHGNNTCDMCRLIDEGRIDLMSIISKKTNRPVFQKNPSSVCLIRNDFPYNNWDGRKVTQHYQLVPRAHHCSALDLNAETRTEFHFVLDQLLDHGAFSATYIRSSFSPTSSVPIHLHAHMFSFGQKVVSQSYDGRMGNNQLKFEEN